MDGLQGRRPFPIGAGVRAASPGDGREPPAAGSPGLARSPVPAHRIVPPLGHTPMSSAVPEMRDIGAAGPSSVERLAAREASHVVPQAARTLAKAATLQQVREVAPPLGSASPRTDRS